MITLDIRAGIAGDREKGRRRGKGIRRRQRRGEREGGGGRRRLVP